MDPWGTTMDFIDRTIKGYQLPALPELPSGVPQFSIPILSDIEKVSGVKQSLATSLMAGTMHTEELIGGRKSFWTPAQFFVPASFEDPKVLAMRSSPSSSSYTPRSVSGGFTAVVAASNSGVSNQASKMYSSNPQAYSRAFSSAFSGIKSSDKFFKMNYTPMFRGPYK